MHKVKKLLYRLYSDKEYLLKSKHIESMTISEAKKILDNYYYQKPPVFQQKVKYNPEYDLMIIVPVYNCEEFLNECIQSLIGQKTKYSYKIIFVDDGSTDDSSSILDSYIENERVEVIHQNNMGIAGARNTALKNICGRYIMFVDSDDLLADNAVQLLMDVALAKNADLVEGAHIEFVDARFKNNELKIEALSGYPWGKVIYFEKMTSLCFPEGYQYEDTIMSTLLIPSCKKIYTIPNVTYYYRKNNKSITAKLEKRKESIDTFYMTYYCFNEASRRGYKIYLEDLLHQVRLNWLRTQNLPVKIKKAIFILEKELLLCLCNESDRLNVKGVLLKLEKVLRKASFCAYEWLMDNWKV